MRRSKTNKKPVSIKTADVIASAITMRLLVVVTEATYVMVAGVSAGLANLRLRACELRFVGGDKADSGNGEGGQPFLAQDAEP